MKPSISFKEIFQEPSSLSFRLLERTHCPFWCFVFLTLFNLQGARSSIRFWLMDFYDTTLGIRLSRVFFRFFPAHSHRPRRKSLSFNLARISRELFYITTFAFACQALFSRFPNFFGSFAVFRAPLNRRSINIPDRSQDVNPFFHFLRHFFAVPPARQLAVAVPRKMC